MGAKTQGMAADGAWEARVHTMGAETRGTAADGAREVRAHVMGAKTWGMAADGARDRAKTRGEQRGGVWACVRGVDVGEMHVTAMCAPRGPGCMWCMHEGCGQRRWWPMVCGLGAEAAARMGRKGQQRAWAVKGSGTGQQHIEAVASGEAGGGGT